jgi:glycine/D-amino acid oxidase-like deaminating enzyme
LEISKDVRGELASIRIGYTNSATETEIPMTRLLLSAGAWTPQLFALLFKASTTKIPVTYLAGHSLVVKTPGEASDLCHSVYCSHEELSPELYSRPNGVIYLAGVNSSSIPLPRLATGAKVLQASLDRLMGIAKRFISAPDLEVVRTGLCFRPVTKRGTPILARLDDELLGDGIRTRKGAEGGVFVAVGHGPWGIALSLGTGKVMAEMMQGRKLSAEVSRLAM